MLTLTLLSALACIWLYMTLWYGVSRLTRRNDLADLAWGPGFVVLYLTLMQGQAQHSEWPVRTTLHFVLVLAWAVRLALYIGARNLKKPEEDFRYQNWRKEWGKTEVWRSYLQIFMLQGALLFLIAQPIVITSLGRPPGSLGLWDGIGFLGFCIGLTFEAVGDAQMAKFKKDPKNRGKIIQSGLWSRTRHPNYFGETLVWWSLGLIAFQTTLETSWLPWIAWIGPLTITFLLLKVSGIPMLEKKYEGNPEFEAYKQKTPAFCPRLF